MDKRDNRVSVKQNVRNNSTTILTFSPVKQHKHSHLHFQLHFQIQSNSQDSKKM